MTTPQRAKRLAVRVAVGLLVVTAAAVALLGLTFIPGKLDLPSVAVGDLPKAMPPSEMTVSALPTGSYEIPAALTYRGGSWRDTRHLSMTSVLVRHPKGNLLIDAGAGRNVDAHVKVLPALQRSPYEKGMPVVNQLAAMGLKPGDLAGVIPTHAHWDHISGVQDLPGVPLMVSTQAKAFIDAGTEDTKVLQHLGKLDFQLYEFEGGPYLGFSRSHDVWGDGSVVIVPAPGHTPDSVVVFVNLPSGTRLAFVGDMTFQMEGLDLPAEKPWILRRVIGERDEEVRHEMALIRSARSKYPQLHAIPAHDGAAFGAIPVAPASAR